MGFYVDEFGVYQAETDSDTAASFGWVEVENPPAHASQVWDFDGEVWEGSPYVTPSKVTMRQARIALHRQSMLTSVETAIDSLPEPMRTEARIEWDYSQEVHRNKEFVVTLGGILGLNSAQLDALFIEAASIQ